ncbi:MAG: serine O-acetyltransferase [Chloroflexota bacterium]
MNFLLNRYNRTILKNPRRQALPARARLPLYPMPPYPPPQDLPTRLVYLRRSRLFGRLAYLLLKLLGVEIPRAVPIGPGFELVHGGVGVVIHSKARIGAGVKIYPGVTLGRADIYRPADQSRFESIVIEDQVILAPGAKVLCKAGVLTVGRGAVLGANAVLLESAGAGEMWAGAPARCIGRREGFE